MGASSLLGKQALVKEARKVVRAIFPVLKEKGEPLKDVTEKLLLVFNHDLDIRLQHYAIHVNPIGYLDNFARGVIGYSVGTNFTALRWLRLSNRKFVVKGAFGIETATYNSLGDVIGTAPYDHIMEEKLEQAFQRFLGEIEQAVAPPDGVEMPSDQAVKREHVAVTKRPAICYSIKCSELNLPNFTFEIECGPGFSPRTFVHDLGKDLGSCAHVEHLEQTQHGPFTLEHALPSYRWSWDEVSATSEKLHSLWSSHVEKVRSDMKHRYHIFQSLARYY